MSRALCLLLFTLPAAAQTIRPVLTEHGEKARGKFELVNDTLEPLNVVLDARSFTVTDSGELAYRPLDKSIHLKLSTMSFRIPPQQNYWVFYEATADQNPAWFVIYASFTGYGFKTADGMNVRLQLPHTVYLLPKGKVQKQDLNLLRAEYDPGTQKVRVRLGNSSGQFGRCLAAEVSRGRKKASLNGFPLFPKAERQVEIEWEDEELPDKITLRFQDFTIEEKLQVVNR
ncbi:MAG: hypothetical protein ACRD2M_05415 [Terriglobales bacterium]